MGLYKEITTEAGSTLSYWDYGIVEVNTSASEAKDQNANVNIWGYHNLEYYNNDAPPIERWNSYSCGMVSGTDHYPYMDLTGVSGEVTGTKRLGPDLPDGWSWTENSVSGWMASSSDIRNGAQAWALVCIPAFSAKRVLPIFGRAPITFTVPLLKPPPMAKSYLSKPVGIPT